MGNAVKVAGRPAFGDLHPRFGFPAARTTLPELASSSRCCSRSAIWIRQHRPSRWVGVEVKPQPGESSELLLAQTRRTWRDAWWQQLP